MVSTWTAAGINRVSFGVQSFVEGELRRTGRKVTITLPGGDLLIEWRERDDHVLMTGPVEYEYEGTFDPALFAGAA